VVPSSAIHLFQTHYFSILSCFHNFKESLKATALVLCLDNGNVIHKYLLEMRRLAHDDTPFLSTMQLRSITLAWWPDDVNFIPLDIHGHDRPTRDETSYPPTNLLIILNHVLL
jgi:hypothetical protein